ncbi:MAG: GNAT family N-acetyltransferase [Nitrospirae bacterium]|nr:GNAT family N-acetyltransferase [Nitrospirota bacterium]
MVEIKVINSIEGFKELEPAWTALIGSTEHIFQTWEWNYIWYKHLGKEYDLNILLFIDGGKIAAIIPLVYSKKGHFPWKRYEFMADFVSNYHDIILSSDANINNTILALKDYISENFGKFDYIELRFIPQESLMIKSLNASPLNLIGFDHTPVHMINIDKAFDDYLVKDVPREFRQDIRQQIRKLLKRGSLDYHQCKEDVELQEVLTEFFRLKVESLKKIGHRSSFFEETKFQEFDRELYSSLLKNNWLYLHVLKFDDKIIAINCDIIFNGHVYCHESTYDCNFLKKFSPGHIVRYMEIENAFSLRCKDVDWGQGDLSYKRQWSNTKKETYRFYIFKDKPFIRRYYLNKLRPSLRAAYVYYTEQILPKIRKASSRVFITGSKTPAP